VLLIAANVLIYLLMAWQGQNFVDFDAGLLLRWGANGGALTCDGQWWRLLTSTFEHGGLLHIALNMWCLYNLGWLAELLFGRARYTLLYLLCGVGGSLGSIVWRPNGLSVGASGAIFGIAGALIPAMMLHGNRELRAVLKRQLTSVIFFVGYNILIGAASQRIDNAAHIGGLLTGLALGAAFPTGLDRRGAMGRARVALGTAAMLIVFVGAGALAYHRNLPAIEVERGEKARLGGDEATALAHAQRAVAMNADNARAQFLLGNLLLNARRDPEAAKAFAAVTRLEPAFGEAYVNLCEAEREMGELQEAAGHCEQGVQKMPGEADAWFNLGRVRFQLHDAKGAREALAKAVALNPEGFDENLQYGLMLLEDGQTKQAIPYIKKAHDLHPDDAVVGRLLIETQQ
jgi:rhomboid protease GluP